MGCTTSRHVTVLVDNTHDPDGSKPSGEKDQEPTDTAAPITCPEIGTESFAQVALEAHNSFRSIHEVEPLTLSAELCELSERLCRHLVQAKTFCNSSPDQRVINGQECGESLYRYSGGRDEEVRAGMVVQSWYDEVDNYHADLPGFDITTGHFTQMVWKGTKEMGIAHAYYDDDDGFRQSVVVAHYLPAGNIEGAFEDNVHIPENFFIS